MSSTSVTNNVILSATNDTEAQMHQQQQQHQQQLQQPQKQQQSLSISSSSSMLTSASNSSSSPTSSLTSIATNSPTLSSELAHAASKQSLSNRQSSSNRSHSICSGSGSKTAEFQAIEPELTNRELVGPNISSDSDSSSGVVTEGTGTSRLERSHSCSQTEPNIAMAAAASHSNILAPIVATLGAGQAISLSHESLALANALDATVLGNSDVSHACNEQLPANNNNIPPTSGSVDNLFVSSGSHIEARVGSPIDRVESFSSERVNLATPNAPVQLEDLATPQSQQQTSSSSRFFSSKLNTGSLWSLLSVGSTSSVAADSTNCESNNRQADSQQQLDSNMIDTKSHHEAVNKSSGFFSRVQFKRANSSNQSSANQASISKPKQENPNQANISSPAIQVSNNDQRKRFRFNVRYFGSAILHKNFTLPMLEWIAKDIRRQTIKGAPHTSQRQFTIPTRDIIFEIQSNQLTAISCKDGHGVFVHPMHCVSKYAQLQYDPTCFSYLIRDNKESPFFCHVFQAKSANKVHDIFSAIREVTTARSQFGADPNSASILSSGQSNSMIGLQKSASTDCGPRRNLFAADKNSLFAFPSSSLGSPVITHQRQQQPSAQQLASGQNQQQFVKPFGPMGAGSVVTGSSQMAANQQVAATAANANSQFENSYQFEVMFVKKVKLQCRRVPATFVDDALETLKSYEVLKGGDSKAQIKGIGKRIISASVDERQEYDEACQSPTPGSSTSSSTVTTSIGSVAARAISEDEQRRGSSCSLTSRTNQIKEERESRSCQQSPVKTNTTDSADNTSETCDSQKSQDLDSSSSSNKKQHHQSMESLKSDNHQWIIKSATTKNAPNYANDFSPYNTITSTDLNERIAAIPVVSGSSVSLDHETRQRLARQVRETIMATAANIKKDVYASGDKLDSSSASKALDSLSCTVASSVPPVEDNWPDDPVAMDSEVGSSSLEQPRRASSGVSGGSALHQHSASNNFDLFRRASARQVVKNRTMLLLIGKDELCTISIDKHQMLFSKSFSSIVHCLQGSNNKDHFGLICRDSGKINPQAESYAGFVFKCQSDKVVREIMGALKQVIYSSQHNYHGYNSPYNPLNTHQFIQHPQSPKFEASRLAKMNQDSPLRKDSSTSVSLATKRGFANPIELDSARNKSKSTDHSAALSNSQQPLVGSPPTAITATMPNSANLPNFMAAQKNTIKSMFCDNCPLYWYHRLCCDIESLPAEASKAIILRRIDSSLTEREQDEIYSRFSEFAIDSIDEHNEIFMSILRHQNERKQLRHNQSQAHLSAMAKNAALVKQSSTVGNILSRQSSLASTGQQQKQQQQQPTDNNPIARSHQRSGSSSGSLAQVIASQNNQPTIISDASSAAMDNLMRAKNSISVSIENMLKRRSSARDEQYLNEASIGAGSSIIRSGSFKSASRETRGHEGADANSARVGDNFAGNLRRSQSTNDYGGQANSSSSSVAQGWRDSISRTINDDLANNPLVGLFRRRSSTLGSKTGDLQNAEQNHQESKIGVSADCINQLNIDGSINCSAQQTQPSSPNIAESRFTFAFGPGSQRTGSNAESNSPSSLLSSAFWKKSIFDKIRQPTEEQTVDNNSTQPEATIVKRKRSREELRSLWRKAILEQITLLKMDKQNQQLQAVAASNQQVEYNIQRLKLNYKDVIYSRDAMSLWQKLLKQDPTCKVDFVEVARHVRLGVPKQRRGEVWMFLMNQYQLRHGTSFQPADSEFKGDANQTYRSLLSQLSVQQHEIFVDIGRTFPSHPYYSQYLSIGQLSLFNLLKAYSLLDQEVGYCQGLSFVAGILLLHVDSEDEAFELMRHLLFNFGLRKQYLPSMNALHLQLYQMTRLLRDHEYDLFNHFDRHDISPSLYAAPWFLTLFASQFPLGFVSRLLDLIYLIGIEAIFRVSLNLLAYHRSFILECSNLESTMEYMKTNLVKISDKNLVKIFDKSLSLDLRNKLIEYEIEYTFYCAEDRAKLSHSSAVQHPSNYKTVSNNFRPSSKNTPNKDENSNEGKAHDNDEFSDQSQENEGKHKSDAESTSVVADATATVIIQHLLANNHLKSLRSNYTY